MNLCSVSSPRSGDSRLRQAGDFSYWTERAQIAAVCWQGREIVFNAETEIEAALIFESEQY